MFISKGIKKNIMKSGILIFSFMVTGLLFDVSFGAVSDTNQVQPPLIVERELKTLPPDTFSTLRRFPYPYRSMLALCSDIDETTSEEFKSYHKFLNTFAKTAYGKGLGLDVGDTFWMYMANDLPHKVDKEGHGVDHVMTYFKNTDFNNEKDAKLIKHYYDAGWIDCMHGFGDFSRVSRVKNFKFTRELAQKAWETLQSAGIKPFVWINHGNEVNVQNFGTYDEGGSYQQGDNPSSPYYHTDITIKNGIKFIWDAYGGRFGNYNPIFIRKLRDGQRVWAFRRYTSELKRVNKGHVVDWNWTPQFLTEQLTQKHLDSIVNLSQYSIVAQHFGILNQGFPFGKPEIKALRMLQKYQDDGKILVARTSRLLNYALAYNCIKYNTYTFKNIKWINIISVDDPIFGSKIPEIKDLRGITFYTESPSDTHILIDGNPISENELQRNDADYKGFKSIGIKWFSKDTFDYSSND